MMLARYFFRLSEAKRKNAPELFGLFNGGIPSFVWMINPASVEAGVPVFCYHATEPQSFAADLQFLSENNYTTLDGDALLDHLTRRRLAPPRSVAITFDDGATSLFKVAFPLLRKFGHKMIAFVCPGLHDDTVEGGLCSWAQLEEMQVSTHVDVQSHSLEHRLPTDWPRSVPLTGVDNVVIGKRRGPALSMENDFQRARDILEQRLGKKIRHFAFPVYRGTAVAIRAAKQAGYEALYGGTSAGAGLNRPGRSPEKIGRISSEFLRRLPGDGRRPLTSVLRHRLHGPAMVH